MFPLCLFFKTFRPEFQVLAKDEGLILMKRARISDREVGEPGLTVLYQQMPVALTKLWFLKDHVVSLLLILH